LELEKELIFTAEETTKKKKEKRTPNKIIQIEKTKE